MQSCQGRQGLTCSVPRFPFSHRPSGCWSCARRASMLIVPPAPCRACLHRDFTHSSAQCHFLRESLPPCLKEQPRNSLVPELASIFFMAFIHLLILLTLHHVFNIYFLVISVPLLECQLYERVFFI